MLMPSNVNEAKESQQPILPANMDNPVPPKHPKAVMIDWKTAKFNVSRKVC